MSAPSRVRENLSPPSSRDRDATRGRLETYLEGLSAYSYLPARLQRLQSIAQEDVFGLTDKLTAIRHVLESTTLGNMVDLGGNSGYFSLSLVDVGIAARSTVYDLNDRALLAGRAMAEALAIDDKVEFIKQKVDLSFLRSMPFTDTVVCLNLLHHAGTTFDLEEVARAGWEDYMGRWLEELRSKCRLAIIGLGFKNQKPRHWKVLPWQRPRRVFDLATRNGWSVLYDANVEDIHSLGVARSNGLQTRRRLHRSWVRHLATGCRTSTEAAAKEKRRKYHLYILN
jgi:hypothetical protein